MMICMNWWFLMICFAQVLLSLYIWPDQVFCASWRSFCQMRLRAYNKGNFRKGIKQCVCKLFCTLLTISLCWLGLQAALNRVMRHCRYTLQKFCLERRSDSLDTLNTDNGWMGSRDREFNQFHRHQELVAARPRFHFHLFPLFTISFLHLLGLQGGKKVSFPIIQWDI